MSPWSPRSPRSACESLIADFASAKRAKGSWGLPKSTGSVTQGSLFPLRHNMRNRESTDEQTRLLVAYRDRYMPPPSHLDNLRRSRRHQMLVHVATALLRRELLERALFAFAVAAPSATSAAVVEWQDPRWGSLGLNGTREPLRSIEEAAEASDIGNIGLYPDPLLRRVAAPVTDFSPSVEKVSELLVAGMKSNAITAAQYGVDARIIALKGPASPQLTPIVFVNPSILSRSAEERMVSWREICLVLPPNLEVELLRDEVVEVAAQDVFGVPFRKTLRGEAARAFQHELDHLDGILIVDHAGIDELPAAIASLERPYHDARQRRAFARRVYQGETLYY